MKTIIGATPSFHITLNDEELNILLRCSECHYDITCKLASKPSGFLYGFRNLMNFVKEEEKTEITAIESFRTLDTMLKIIETPPPDVDRSTAMTLAISIHKALSTCNTSFPKIEIEVN